MKGQGLRITSGALGGRTLEVPKGGVVRPTSGRVREAAFSILGRRVEDANVLDLFAGCGSLGLEALSRGAAWCAFVEQNRHVARVLRDNIARMALSDRTQVARGDASDSRVFPSDRCYHLAVLDPPYGGDLVGQALGALVLGSVMAGGATVLAVHERSARPVAPPSWVTEGSRTYGDSALSWWSLPEEP